MIKIKKREMQDFETIDLTPGIKSETIAIEEVIVVGKFDPYKDEFKVEKRDLTKPETRSISASILPLIPELDHLLKDRVNHLQHFKELKAKITNILNDKNVSAEDTTRKKWLINLEKQKDLISLSKMMSNLTLAGAGLKAGLDSY